MDETAEPAAAILPPGRYVARQHVDGSDRVLGEVELGADGVLSLPPGAAPGPLDKIVASMNAAERLHVDVAPPPDAPRFAMASRIVERGDPGFIAALADQLARYYRLELIPA